jgi:hypothetical protein
MSLDKEVVAKTANANIYSLKPRAVGFFIIIREISFIYIYNPDVIY